MTEIPQQYFEAGRIAAAVREETRHLVVPEKMVLNLCEEVEALIRQRGGEPAFPCNVSINSVAAHYTAGIEDEVYIKAGDVVKVDIGVHRDGYIADTAITVTLDPTYEPLVEATQEALRLALASVKPGVKVGEIGRIVASVAEQRGFIPITNLGGHLVQAYTIHAGKAVPNIWVPNTPSFKVGEVYAVEPFFTLRDGAGSVAETRQAFIYSLTGRRRTGVRELDAFVEYLWQRFRNLPFAARWLTQAFERGKVEEGLRRLIALKVVRSYPVLVEAKGRVVAQSEHTVAITERGVLVVTEAG